MNVLIVWIMLLLLSNIINKTKPNVLYCGIWGFSGKEGKKADMKKILILGLYNRTRGTDSCGYYYNGNIVKGFAKESDFKDFIVKNRITSGDVLFENMMLHARKSTYGAHTEENAHPHEVGNYVQTHNGTIKNIWTLCTAHGIVHTNIHVDSLGLAHIIEKDGFGVLNEYEGHAALTMVFKDDPQSMYLYHGASRDKVDSELWEERPLYTLETAEGLYYSSIEESLIVISNGKQVPKTLPHNGVWLVQNGVIVRDVFTVERENKNVPKTPVYEVERNVWSKGGAYNLLPPKQLMELPFKGGTNATGGIFNESKPFECVSNDLYYRCGRYFTFRTTLSDKNVPSFTDVLMNGVFVITREGKILVDNQNTSSKYETYYFIRGCMMRDKDSYNKIIGRYTDVFTNTTRDLAFLINRDTRYAIASLPGESVSPNEIMGEKWYKDGKPFTGSVNPKFSSRVYNIKKGFLHSITNPSDEDEMFSIDKLNSSDYIVGDIAIESINNMLVFPKEEANVKELSGQDLNDFPLLPYIQELVETWSEKVLKETDVVLIPEVVLVYLEFFFEAMCVEEIPREFTASESVNGILLYLIQTGKTLYAHLSDCDYIDAFEDIENMKDCFNAYSSEEVLLLENRYSTLDFVSLEQLCKKDTLDYWNFNSTKGDETRKEDASTIHAKESIYKIEEHTALLEEMADNLQKNTDDESQKRAFSLYKTVDRLRRINLGDKVEFNYSFIKSSGEVVDVFTTVVECGNGIKKAGGVSNPLYGVRLDKSNIIDYRFGCELTKI